MALRDPQVEMPKIAARLRGYDHPKARVYAKFFDRFDYFPDGIWHDVQMLDMKFNLQIAMGLRPEDIEEIDFSEDEINNLRRFLEE